MPFKFTNQPLKQGLYEPEGIFLNLPFAGEGLVLQPFGIQQQQPKDLTYNGVPLKGHIGVAFGVMPSATLLAVDDGRVVEISYDQAGLGRYIKLAHPWGESLCALIGEASVDSGHRVVRGEPLGRASSESLEALTWGVLFFAVRVQPFNRFDGWGGFSNPLAYLSVDDVRFPEESDQKSISLPVHQLRHEEGRLRRP